MDRCDIAALSRTRHLSVTGDRLLGRGHQVRQLQSWHGHRDAARRAANRSDRHCRVATRQVGLLHHVSVRRRLRRGTPVCPRDRHGRSAAGDLRRGHLGTLSRLRICGRQVRGTMPGSAPACSRVLKPSLPPWVLPPTRSTTLASPPTKPPTYQSHACGVRRDLYLGHDRHRRDSRHVGPQAPGHRPRGRMRAL